MCSQPQTVKVHLPPKGELTCAKCQGTPKTFTYRRAKERNDAGVKTASVRSWRFQCPNCTEVNQITSTVKLDEFGNRSEPEVDTVIVKPIAQVLDLAQGGRGFLAANDADDVLQETN